MTDQEDNTDETNEPVNPAELLDLELNFVPDWARKPTQTDYFNYKPREERSERGGSPRGRSQGRGGPSSPRPRSDSRPPRPRPDSREPRARADSREPRPREDRFQQRSRQPERQREERVEIPAVNVRFLPLPKAISEIARKILANRRAHPMLQVASLYLANPESCTARVEVDKTAGDCFLLQCKICGMIALSEETLNRHMVKAHINDYMDKVEEQRDPPSGSFSSVAQCGLSGTLLGPANHHSYSQKLREVHSHLYANMSLEQYSSRIKTVHDEESIEKWKQEYSVRIGYRPKGDESAELMTQTKAEDCFLKEIAPKHIQKTRRASLPVPLCRSIEDTGLQLAIKNEWMKEQRFPISIMMSLRGAFASKGLHTFKAGKGKSITFVTPIPLAPLKIEHVTESIKEVMLYLQEHPGSSRADIAKALRPDAEPDSEQVQEILSPLGWLIDRGHIIEFFNGTLSIPRSKK